MFSTNENPANIANVYVEDGTTTLPVLCASTLKAFEKEHWTTNTNNAAAAAGCFPLPSPDSSTVSGGDADFSPFALASVASSSSSSSSPCGAHLLRRRHHSLLSSDEPTPTRTRSNSSISSTSSPSSSSQSPPSYEAAAAPPVSSSSSWAAAPQYHSSHIGSSSSSSSHTRAAAARARLHMSPPSVLLQQFYKASSLLQQQQQRQKQVQCLTNIPMRGVPSSSPGTHSTVTPFSSASSCSKNRPHQCATQNQPTPYATPMGFYGSSSSHHQSNATTCYSSRRVSPTKRKRANAASETEEICPQQQFGLDAARAPHTPTPPQHAHAAVSFQAAFDSPTSSCSSVNGAGVGVGADHEQQPQQQQPPHPHDMDTRPSPLKRRRRGRHLERRRVVAHSIADHTVAVDIDDGDKSQILHRVVDYICASITRAEHSSTPPHRRQQYMRGGRLAAAGGDVFADPSLYSETTFGDVSMFVRRLVGLFWGTAPALTVTSLILLGRFLRKSTTVSLREDNWRGLLETAYLVAHKMLEDESYTNKVYAGAMQHCTVEHLNLMEVKFMEGIDFDAYVKPSVFNDFASAVLAEDGAGKEIPPLPTSCRRSCGGGEVAPPSPPAAAVAAAAKSRQASPRGGVVPHFAEALSLYQQQQQLQHAKSGSSPLYASSASSPMYDIPSIGSSNSSNAEVAIPPIQLPAAPTMASTAHCVPLFPATYASTSVGHAEAVRRHDHHLRHRHQHQSPLAAESADGILSRLLVAESRAASFAAAAAATHHNHMASVADAYAAAGVLPPLDHPAAAPAPFGIASSSSHRHHQSAMLELYYKHAAAAAAAQCAAGLPGGTTMQQMNLNTFVSGQ